MSEREVIEILDGLSIEVFVSSKSSNYTCCAFVETTPPGGGPPHHLHLEEEEIFTVLEGDYEFYDGDAWTPMHVGSPVLSRRNTYHAFRNVGDVPGRMMLTTNAGGIDDSHGGAKPGTASRSNGQPMSGAVNLSTCSCVRVLVSKCEPTVCDVDQAVA